MKLLIALSFILGFICAFVRAKALGDVLTNGIVQDWKQDLNQDSLHGQGTMNVKEEAIDLLRRLTREAASNSNAVNSKPLCKYKKGTWSACDKETKSRTRTDTLKRGDANVCENVKTRSKECKAGKKGNKERNSTKGRGNKQNRQKKPADIQ